MARRIDWDKMIDDLRRVSEAVSEDMSKEGIHIGLTLGRKPPRIYVTFDRPDELDILVEDLSDEAYEEHRKLCERMEDRASVVNKIMVRHGLKNRSL
jgi:hypothetical protein